MTWANNLHQILALAQMLGRDGDDRIVHVNGLEEAVLKALGGAGTINPVTGLREYRFGGSSAGDTSEGRGDPTGADRGGGGIGGGNGGGRNRDQGPRQGGDPSVGAAAGAIGGNRGNNGGTGNSGKKTGVRGVGGFTSPTGRLEDRADVQAHAKATGKSSSEAAKDISRAWGAAHQRGLDAANEAEEDFFDMIGNWAADLLGFEEVAPEYDINNLNTKANWSWDPVETALAVGGMFNPTLSLLSKLYGGYEWFGGPRPSVNLGTSVFGQDQQMNRAANLNRGWGGGFLGGDIKGGAVRSGGGNGGFSEKWHNNDGKPPKPIEKPVAKPSSPPTQAQTPPSTVSYYLPLKDRDTGDLYYIFEGTNLGNPNFGRAQGWGANIVIV